MRAAAIVALLFGCGRIGFDPLASTGDGGATDGAVTDGTVGAVHWVKTFAQRFLSTTALTDSFSFSATNAGDAIVVYVFCESGTEPAGVALSASGWTFDELDPLVGTAGTEYWATELVAIAPNTSPATFTVNWLDAAACMAISEVGDEFTGNDPTGDATTFDGHANTFGNGNCETSLVTGHAGDLVWAACNDTMLTGPGIGFTMGTSDGQGGRTEYRGTGDPAGTTEDVAFKTSTGVEYYVSGAVAIAPAP